MENNNNQPLNSYENKWESSHKGRFYTGALIVIVGLVFLFRQMNLLHAPWLFSWPVLLMAIGLFIGARHGFMKSGWIFPFIVGLIFFVQRFGVKYFHLDMEVFQLVNKFIWPVLIIGVGLFFIFRPRRDRKGIVHIEHSDQGEPELEVVSIFGGVKRSVLSKEFRGGEVVCVFGGAELNFMQAGLSGNVVLDITMVFGGAKIIVPSNWEVKSEAVAIMGGIDDKRQIQLGEGEHPVLIIRGTTIFGGLEIRSY